MRFLIAVVVIALGGSLACVGADALSLSNSVESLIGGAALLVSGGFSALGGAIHL